MNSTGNFARDALLSGIGLGIIVMALSVIFVAAVFQVSDLLIYGLIVLIIGVIMFICFASKVIQW